MKRVQRFWRGSGILCLLAIGSSVAVLDAAERRERAARGNSRDLETVQVELFDAMRQGTLEVKFIVKSSKQANLIVKNISDKPLSVELPAAFAGVPVLAQIGGGGGGFGGGGGGGGGGQGVGGGGGGRGGGGGGGQFNVAPEKIAKIQLACVCLEHGKDEPRAAMQYEIKPIEELSDRPVVHELLKLFGQGQIDQRVAKAAAWHLANDMSWEELAAKRIRRAGGVTYPYFHPDELRHAVGLANKAVQAVMARSDSEVESHKTPRLPRL